MYLSLLWMLLLGILSLLWDGLFLLFFSLAYPVLAEDIKKLVVANSNDYLVWCESTSSVVTCSDASDSFHGDYSKEWWGKHLWAHFIPPSRSFLF